MDRITKIKYIQFINKLPLTVNPDLLKPGEYVLTKSLNVREGQPFIRVDLQVPYPSISIEFEELLPALTAVSNRIGNELSFYLNNKVRAELKAQHAYSCDALVVDGNNMAHRVYFTHKLTYHRQNTGVKYGMLRSLLSLYSKYNPKQIVVCFDAGTPKLRKELLPEYKADRHVDEPKEGQELYTTERDEVYKQIDDLHNWLSQFGIITCRCANYEADDLVAAMVSRIPGRLFVVSGDQDLYQLVDDRIGVIDPMAKTEIDYENFASKIGVPHSAYLLYRALVGDHSDNIAGIPGIGPVGAKKLVRERNSLGLLKLGIITGKVNKTVISRLEAAGGDEGLEGGLKRLQNILRVIDLSQMQPTYEHILAGLRIPRMWQWSLAERELVRLGFMTLATSDKFRLMSTALAENAESILGELDGHSLDS